MTVQSYPTSDDLSLKEFEMLAPNPLRDDRDDDECKEALQTLEPLGFLGEYFDRNYCEFWFVYARVFSDLGFDDDAAVFAHEIAADDAAEFEEIKPGSHDVTYAYTFALVYGLKIRGLDRWEGRG